MNNLQNLISSESDKLIDLLVAQCTDLQELLTLARHETAAVEQQDFDQVLSISSERAKLGARLESYHRQIAELRDVMGEVGERVVSGSVAKESVRLITEIQTTDCSSQALLRQERSKTVEALSRLEAGRRNSAAYFQDARSQSLNYDRLA